MSMKYANLLSPLKIRNKILKTRLLYPMAQPHFLQANELYPADGVVSFFPAVLKTASPYS